MKGKRILSALFLVVCLVLMSIPPVYAVSGDIDPYLYQPDDEDIGYNSVTLHWMEGYSATPYSNFGTRYVIVVWTIDGVTEGYAEPCSTTGDTYTVRDLIPGVEYRFAIGEEYIIGNYQDQVGLISNYVYVRTKFDGVTAVEGLEFVDTTAYVARLRWLPSLKGNETDTITYKLYACENNGEGEYMNTSGEEVADDGYVYGSLPYLEPDTDYQAYVVPCIEETGFTGPASQRVSFHTGPEPTDVYPVIHPLQDGDITSTSIRLSWDEATDVEKYFIMVRQGSTIINTYDEYSTSTSIYGLEPDTWYDITVNGQIVDNFFGTPVSVKTLKQADIAAGSSHTLLLKEDGTVWSAGYNNSGQLGFGDTVSVKTYRQIPNLSNIIAVDANRYNSIALKSNGTVYTWGYTAGVYTPMQMNLSNIIEISAGNEYFMALDKSGNVWTWGNNEYGQLGDGTYTNKEEPVKVTTIDNIKHISAGGMFAMALKQDGTIYTWGENVRGQLGNNSTQNNNIPVQVTSISNVCSISAGYRHALALKKDGTVWAWGSGGYYQLGNGSGTDKHMPIKIASFNKPVKQIFTKVNSSYAVDEDGTLFGWGYNDNGQVGCGSDALKVFTPTSIGTNLSLKNIGCGQNHSMYLTNTNELYVTGNNTFGQIGLDNNTTKINSFQYSMSLTPNTIQ